MIQQLNGTGEIDPAELLLPEMIPEHLVVEDVSVINHDESEYESLIEVETHKEYEDKIQKDERVIFWLPQNVCLVNPFVYTRE